MPVEANQHGHTFRLLCDVLALTAEGGRQSLLTLPQGSSVTLLEDDPKDLMGTNLTQMVELLWQERRVMMFAVDLRTFGEVQRDEGDSRAFNAHS